MDIFNRPPAISEDTLQYALYPPPKLTDVHSTTSLVACVLDVVHDLLAEFIWHRDSFELKVVKNPDAEGYILQGRMRVGDSVDDEWCAVWLLKEISSKWDLAISRRFRRKLPGTAESDVEGEDEDEVEDDEWICADDAVRLVRDSTCDTLAPEAVEKIVWQRISGYPAALKNHVHLAKAWIPLDIAKALTVDPSLVQKAVETFYTRDALQLRAAHRMSRFPPHTSVLRPIKLTRTAYAQLVGQKFFPPKIFGSWQEREVTKEWRWRDLGMKIAVGFEMLYQEAKSRSSITGNTDSKTSYDNVTKQALRRDPNYIKYIQNLTAANYFKGEVEGSELWQKLENKAVTAYFDARREDNASRQSFASQANSAISQVSELPIVSDQEDNDQWLNVDVQDFDEMLKGTMGSGTNQIRRDADAMDIDVQGTDQEERMATTQAAKLTELATKVEQFVEGEGDIEGAMFEDENFSNEEFSDEEDLMSEQESEEDMDTKAAERQAAMDKLVPALDPSEYGKMPSSFHSNSQRVAVTTIESERVEELSSTKPPQPLSEAKFRMKPIRPPILTRDRFEGVDSDDETDEESDEESDEERPQVVGEIEIDMAEEEEEFLEFSRQTLGISDEQWIDIIQDRKRRGAFVPASVSSRQPKSLLKDMPAKPSLDEGKKTLPGEKRDVDVNLNSFEAVMKAMDMELARSRHVKTKATQSSTSLSAESKGKGKESAVKEGEDIEAALEAELNAKLERDEEEEGGEESIDYNLIKNFLESFKSQGGLPGPVGNLAGRLQPDWRLPRDT
ncbi:hypothetical protein AX17_000640 [Amanita inopinata Kibby_2008]|nr:hypothetical protein AX17_000640 [Amanita inopinata Kibby_2008]